MEVQAIKSGQVSTCQRGWESATKEEVQAVAPKSPKAQELAKQLHQLGGAFLLPHMQLPDAWVLTVFADRVNRDPGNPIKFLLCKLMVLELGQELPKSKRSLLLPLLPERLRKEVAENPRLFPKPKPVRPKSTLVHKPNSHKGFWRSLLGA